MHIVMTDILTCPRCGPAFGLILLADRVEDRRVQQGALGCANCREKYAVGPGVIDFTGSGVAPTAAAMAVPPGAGGSASLEDEAALRLAALLGVSEGPGYVLLAGAAAAHAGGLARLIDDLEVLVALPDAAVTGARRVTELRLAGQLPLSSGRLEGAALSGAAAHALLDEAVRTVSPLGRIVLEDADAAVLDRASALGLRVLAAEAATTVLARQ
jgi:uncharacterized protein YbaR (Trm112 family)